MYDLGVTVGRFQVHELHDGHLSLLDSMSEAFARNIVFLGVSPDRNSITDPLDFISRKEMIARQYPKFEIYPLHDCETNREWIKVLDSTISSLRYPNQDVILVGGRDSFLEKYRYGGSFSYTVHTPEKVSDLICSSDIRREISNQYTSSPEYRAGMIAAPSRRWPSVISTVDIAVHDILTDKFLVARKKNQDGWRFVGGFTDISSDSNEADAIRELREETGIIAHEMKYITSKNIDDWRYTKSNRIRTSFFYTGLWTNTPEARDDIEEVRWVDRDFFTTENIIETHQPLAELLLKYLKIHKL